jgi:hypothetical protein
MNSSPSELWNLWHLSEKVRELAEAWMATPDLEWTDEVERLYGLFHSDPETALATMFCIMQISDDKQLLGKLAAGPLEDFLGVQGEAYIDMIHSLALQHRRLRQVLGGVWQGSMSKSVWRRIEILKQETYS